MLKEQPPHFWAVKDNPSENGQKKTGDIKILHRVVGVKRYTVLRDTYEISVFLDLNTVWIIGSHRAKRREVKDHEPQNG